MPVGWKCDNLPVLDNSSPLPSQVFFNVRYVDSSNVRFVGWPSDGDPAMLVEYQGGGRYIYLGVSRQRAVAAAYAPSTGKYINERIKPHFEVVKLR